MLFVQHVRTKSGRSPSDFEENSLLCLFTWHPGVYLVLFASRTKYVQTGLRAYERLYGSTFYVRHAIIARCFTTIPPSAEMTKPSDLENRIAAAATPQHRMASFPWSSTTSQLSKAPQQLHILYLIPVVPSSPPAKHKI
ncbi:hypothetical protein IG631_11547 [Alternaria alternata]|nr:hypothetical protein IG631_11547 [Alternaria alternata]